MRELQVLKGIGNQAIVASICPTQITNMGAADYGYRPAVDAIIEQLKGALTGQAACPASSPSSTDGQVSCVVLEAFNHELRYGQLRPSVLGHERPPGRRAIPQVITPEVGRGR